MQGALQRQLPQVDSTRAAPTMTMTTATTMTMPALAQWSPPHLPAASTALLQMPPGPAWRPLPRNLPRASANRCASSSSRRWLRSSAASTAPGSASTCARSSPISHPNSEKTRSGCAARRPQSALTRSSLRNISLTRWMVSSILDENGSLNARMPRVRASWRQTRSVGVKA